MVNKVRVNIAGTPYAIATTDPEKYILSLAKKLDENGNYLFELPKMEKKSNRTAAQEPQA